MNKFLLNQAGVPQESEALNYDQWKNDFLRVVLRISSIIFFVIILVAFTSNTIATNILYLTLNTIVVAAAFLPLNYSTRAFVLLLTLYITATSLLINWGIEGEASMVYLATITLTALLYEKRYEYIAMGVIAISILSVAALALNGQLILNGWLGISKEFYTLMVANWTAWIVYLADVMAIGIILVYAVRLLKGKFEKILEEARSSLNGLTLAHNQMEIRIAERTRALEVANEENASRAEHLRAIAEISRTTASIHQLDRLLPAISSQINQRLGYYHVGIYLSDDQNQFTILRASNSEGGQRLVLNGHRLRIGQPGLVGIVTQTGQPRLAHDTDVDIIFVKNPELPQTRAELTLPLLVGTSVIGALDIQSVNPEDFNKDDISTFSILADQMATAIQNARSYEQAQRALIQSEVTSRQLTNQIWSTFIRDQSIKGYRFDGLIPQPLKEGSRTHAANEKTIPIKLRGEVIGNLRIHSSDPSNDITEDELVMATATADRLALALESARLLDDAQRRAAKERTIGDISSKIGGLVNIENILQTAMQELGKTLPNTDIVIQFEKEPK